MRSRRWGVRASARRRDRQLSNGEDVQMKQINHRPAGARWVMPSAEERNSGPRHCAMQKYKPRFEKNRVSWETKTFGRPNTEIKVKQRLWSIHHFSRDSQARVWCVDAKDCDTVKRCVQSPSAYLHEHLLLRSDNRALDRIELCSSQGTQGGCCLCCQQGLVLQHASCWTSL